MTMSWNYAVDEILYGLMYIEKITDETVQWTADSAVHYISLRLGPDVYRCAIDEALVSDRPLHGLDPLPQFDQAQLTNFLRAVAERLDALRPWPEPNFRQLESPQSWQFLRQAVRVARLEASIREVTDVLQTGFRHVGDTHPGQQALVLGLITGETVALLSSYGSGEKVSLLATVDDVPADVIEHFVSATGFPSDDIVPI